MLSFVRSAWRSPVRAAAPILLTLLLAGCNESEDDPRVSPPLVDVATVLPSDAGTRRYSGVVSGRVESVIGFRIPGKVVERLVNAGDSVTAGQPLMRIDPHDYELSQRAANDAVAAARARVIQTSADEARYRSLVSSGAVSRSAYDRSKADADSAASELAAAEARARIAANEVRYTTLRADTNSIVAETLIEPGQVVTAGQPAVRLVPAGPREARVSLPETDLPPIGAIAEARLFSDGTPYPARLRQIAGVADAVTRTFDARFTLDGKAANAPLGSTVTVSLNSERVAGFVSIPITAVLDRGTESGVWIITPLEASDAENRAKIVWRAIQIARLGSETVLVSEGLAPGERIVRLGAQLLEDGATVRLKSHPVAERPER